jgi:ribose 5-phosphate isomerase A
VNDAGKRAAGQAAAELVADDMVLGLGTGSTVAHFLEALAARGVSVRGVPTSEATAARCRALGIGLLDPGEVERLDLGVDGADELTRDLVLTKGGGGALLREKVVAGLCDRFVVIATPDKLVDALADSFPLPVEVIPFAIGPVTRTLERLGFTVTARGDGAYRTDNGNAVLDARLHGGLADPVSADAVITATPGVVCCGLFVDLATEALLGRPDGTVERLTRTLEGD